MAKHTKSSTPEPITVRRMDFQFGDDIPTYWFANDAYRTLMMTALSATFPEGERFFVDSVRAFRDRISDPVLQKQVSGFIGQEAHHSKEHSALNELMQRKGLPMQEINDFVKQGLGFMRKRLSPERQLAMTCALEHFTAIMAEQFMENPEFFEQMDPRVQAIWIWHAIEESEHKAVAFDVYQQLVGDYWIRTSQMALNTVEFLFFTNFHLYRLLKAQGLHRDVRLIGKGLYQFWMQPGWFRKLGPAYREYYRRDFHPWQRNNSEKLTFWRQRLEALRAQNMTAAAA